MHPTKASLPAEGSPSAFPEPDVLVLRDPRESLRKCSLTPLRGARGVRFVDYQPALHLIAGPRVLLHPDGEELGPADRGRALLLIDCSWRRVPTLLRCVHGELDARRLPELASAYPRRSKTFADPARGLASIEALYAAAFLLGLQRPEWLACYRWRERVLELNPALRSG
jgi:pre-rRNA-processing protein TSR3